MTWILGLYEGDLTSMGEARRITVDGNEAAASVAHRAGKEA